MPRNRMGTEMTSTQLNSEEKDRAQLGGRKHVSARQRLLTEREGMTLSRKLIQLIGRLDQRHRAPDPRSLWP